MSLDQDEVVATSSQRPNDALLQLLGELFLTTEDLLYYIRESGPESNEILLALPSGASRMVQMREFILICERRALINDIFFDRLRKRFPAAAAELRHCRELYLGETSGEYDAEWEVTQAIGDRVGAHKRLISEHQGPQSQVDDIAAAPGPTPSPTALELITSWAGVRILLDRRQDLPPLLTMRWSSERPMVVLSLDATQRVEGNFSNQYISDYPELAEVLRTQSFATDLRPERPWMAPPTEYSDEQVVVATAYVFETGRASLHGVDQAVGATLAMALAMDMAMLVIPLLGEGDGLSPMTIVTRIVATCGRVVPGSAQIDIVIRASGFSEPVAVVLNAVAAYPMPATGFGTGLHLAREADDAEVALRVDKYVSTLAHLFRQAGSNFTFGLFGHWGRGKTFLIGQLARELERPANNYATVQFSAWAYPQTPVLWAHLYECFADRALTANWSVRVGRILRAGLHRHGAGGIVGLIFLFALGAFPLGFWFDALVQVYAVIGLAGLFALVRVARRGSLLGQGLRAYLALRRHDEKLGLQAVIGGDLEALLVGWMPCGPPVTASTVTLYFLVVLLAAAALSPWQTTAWTGGWWLSVVLAAIWLSASATLGVLALRLRGAPKQILLIVDDLDRCDPPQMLAVIENLRLFLETPGVGQRMQVAMLVDDRTLAQALRAKYRGVDEVTEADDNLLEESIEKLFLVFLRLPPLSAPDVDELAQKYFGQMRTIAGSRTAASPVSGQPRAAVVRPADAGLAMNPPAPLSQPQATAPVSPELVATPKRAGVEEVFTFTPDEEQVLTAALRVLADHRAGRLGPRTVRSFLFRYQLARLLLSALDEKLEPSELARCLASGHGAEPTIGSELARKIVRQVSLTKG